MPPVPALSDQNWLSCGPSKLDHFHLVLKVNCYISAKKWPIFEIFIF